MKLKELYSKPIDRAVNPAVSATKSDPETQKIEIQEYVFTDEILNGLYRILNSVRMNRTFNHIGIWIDGYYGSGKSHFLKYLDYCITPETQEEALNRMLEAIKEIDPMDGKHMVPTYAEVYDLAQWVKKATIDTCIFNLETAHDKATNKKEGFLQVFWSEFNKKRGFNNFNITLAQLLEKPLAEKGVFEAFKERIAEEMDADWNDPVVAADIIDQELDSALDIAIELAPTLSKDSIKERIIKRDFPMSIERFSAEVASYLKTKDDNYRLIMLADEVSQFINGEKHRYLNLQEIITKLSEDCDNKVWIACTAQQDLSEIMDACQIAAEQDKEGKIKGRFEVKVSLKGTKPEVITQKRILEKKDEVKSDLGKLYDEKKGAFDHFFKLPTTYKGYETKDDFIAYYPFIPYQFKLIMQVFNSFLNLGYVSREVKGNERSIIKVVHATAMANMEDETGKFISFDELYNSMFEEGLQARGQQVIKNAEEMAATYKANPELALRVARVLFMICNISPTDQLVFPATLDNITSLLINDVTKNRITIRDEVSKIVEYFCDNNIIRCDQGKNGNPDKYQFYSEEEMQVASLIQSQQVDANTQAEQLKTIIQKYFTNLKNKENFMTRDFSVGAVIMMRSSLQSSNPDIIVDFLMDADYDDVATLALQNSQNRLLFYMGPQYVANKKLRNAFHWYCQVNKYVATPATTEENQKTRLEFTKRANDMFDNIIMPEFRKILDTCPVISGTNEIPDAELGGKKGTERYTLAVQKHLANIYVYAGLVNHNVIPKTSENLKKAILRPIQPGDYTGMNADLTDAEKKVEDYLCKQIDPNADDITAKFKKAPYGWHEVCTLYVVNELVRRHKRDYSYGNNPNVETKLVADRLLAEKSKFTVRAAVAIPQTILNNFADSWKEIFGPQAALPTSDSTQLFRLAREEEYENSLQKIIKQYNKYANDNARYPFVTPLRNAVDLFDKWMKERDHLTFFNLVISEKDLGKDAVDVCKEVIDFINDHMDKYLGVVNFVRDNRHNFDYLPASVKTDVDDIIDIESLTWPFSIKDKIQSKNKVIHAIMQEQQKLIDDIKREYQKTYNQLVAACNDEGVDVSVLTDVEKIIRIKTASTSIPTLKNNVLTNDYFNTEAAKIQTAKVQLQSAQKAPQPSPTVAGASASTPAPAVTPTAISAPIVVDLETRTPIPLKTEQEVELYLAKLKDQLMKEIAAGKSVMIIK